jgi:plasmid stabilization system protein ParE
VNVSFNPLAERELNDAARYYEIESPGLGSAFVSEVERCSNAILEHPEAGRLILGSIRRRLVNRFPYALLYAITFSICRVRRERPPHS